MLRVLAAIKADRNRQPPYNFDKIAGRIFRRKQTKQRSRSAWKVFNGPFVIAPECIYMDTYGLVRPHEFELGLFEVCRNPDVIEWNNGKQGLFRLDALADFDRFAANDSADRIEVRSRTVFMEMSATWVDTRRPLQHSDVRTDRVVAKENKSYPKRDQVVFRSIKPAKVRQSKGAVMSKGEETRQRIVAEAAKVFNEHGFEGGSLSELMEATGLEKGGIYRHFSSKVEIAAAAFDYAWQEAMDARMHDLDLIPNRVDRLKRLIANFVDRRPPVPGGCPLFNTAVDADDGNPILRERARTALYGWRNRLSSIISEGVDRKEIRRSVDSKKLATLIISSLEGALMISRLERHHEALVAVRSHLETYLDADVRLRSK